MNEEEIRIHFNRTVAEDLERSVGISAILTLLEVTRRYDGNTIQGLHVAFKEAIKIMKETDHTLTTIDSGGEIYQRFITLQNSALESSDFQECKAVLIQRGELFLKNLLQARGKVVKHASNFVVNGKRILTHSRSRVVFQMLVQAKSMGVKFEVYVTKSAPDNSGEVMYNELVEAGIPATLILDSAIGYVMYNIDYVIVGAEAIVESGGILNKIGTYTIAICAHLYRKTFYVLAESFKFLEKFPMDQNDIPKEYKYSKRDRDHGDLKNAHPIIDYTPPQYIKYIFTDKGILIPPAVIEKLGEMYI